MAATACMCLPLNYKGLNGTLRIDGKQTDFLSSTLSSLVMAVMADWKWVWKNGYYYIFNIDSLRISTVHTNCFICSDQ